MRKVINPYYFILKLSNIKIIEFISVPDCDQMNCIEYGFHRLYLRFASNEVYQREAIGRITDKAREIVALEKLASDIALIESEVHESGVPSLPDSSTQKVVKKRPGLSRSQKLQTKKTETEERLAASQNGIVTADRVIGNVKKRIAQKDKKNGNAVNPRKRKTKKMQFEINVSEDEEEQRENGGLDRERDLSEDGMKSSTTAMKRKLAPNASDRSRIENESDDNSIDSAVEGKVSQKAFNKRRVDSESDDDSIESTIVGTHEE
jgi:hypothetical protein